MLSNWFSLPVTNVDSKLKSPWVNNSRLYHQPPPRHNNKFIILSLKLCVNVRNVNSWIFCQHYDMLVWAYSVASNSSYYPHGSIWSYDTRGHFKNVDELLNLRALKISMLHENDIFECMGKIFCVEFQRVPLKFHTKYLTHIMMDVDFIHRWKFKSS